MPRKADSALTRLATVVLYIAVAAGVSAFAYFFYYYQLTQQREFTSPTGAYVSYGIPLLFAVSLLVGIHWFKEKRLAMALVVVSAGAFIYGVEALLGWTPEWFPGYYDDRSRIEFAIDMQDDGLDVVPGVMPWELLDPRSDSSFGSRISVAGKDLLPLAGISGRETAFCSESGRYAVYRGDEHGFNNPPGIWYTGPIDIAALGDAFTHGQCLSVEKGAVGLIRQQYPRTLNLGFDGDGPLLMLATLREYAARVEPRVVLWFYYERNDLLDLVTEERSDILVSYLKDDFSQRLSDRQDEIDNALSGFVDDAIQIRRNRAHAATWRRAVDTLKLAELRTLLGMTYGASSGPVPFREALRQVPTGEKEVKSLREVLLKARSTVDSWGGSLYFVYLPTSFRYTDAPDTLVKSSKDGYNRDLVLKMVRSVELPVIDLHESFAAHPDVSSLYVPGRRPGELGHHNEAGNRLIAEQVLRSLVTE